MDTPAAVMDNASINLNFVTEELSAATVRMSWASSAEVSVGFAQAQLQELNCLTRAPILAMMHGVILTRESVG